MSLHLADLAREEFLKADIDWLVDSFGIVAVKAPYAWNVAHHHLSDVPGGQRVFTSSGHLAGKTATNGYAHSSPLVQAAVPAGSTITGYWIYRDTGVEATSTLVAFYDSNHDSTAVNVPTNGGDVSFTPDPDTGGWFRL